MFTFRLIPMLVALTATLKAGTITLATTYVVTPLVGSLPTASAASDRIILIPQIGGGQEFFTTTSVPTTGEANSVANSSASASYRVEELSINGNSGVYSYFGTLNDNAEQGDSFFRSLLEYSAAAVFQGTLEMNFACSLTVHGSTDTSICRIGAQLQSGGAVRIFNAFQLRITGDGQLYWDGESLSVSGANYLLFFSALDLDITDVLSVHGGIVNGLDHAPGFPFLLPSVGSPGSFVISAAVPKVVPYDFASIVNGTSRDSLFLESFGLSFGGGEPVPEPGGLLAVGAACILMTLRKHVK